MKINKILTDYLDKLPSSKKYNNIKIIEAMDLKEQKFTIEEIRNYIMSQDSLGDVMYNLKAEKIIEANEPEEDDEEEAINYN